MSQDDPGRWDMEADIVVVGTGAAGSSAALFSHEDGARVIMLEKGRRYGGTTEKSGGILHMPNNSFMRDAGIKDERDDAIRYYARLAYPTLYNPNDSRFGLSEHQHSLIAAYYDNASATVDGLQKMGALDPTPWVEWDGKQFFPDYFAHLPENKAPRGRGLLAKDPTTGQAAGGVELIRQLKAAVDKREIPVLLRHRASRLVTNAQGEVIGIEATTDDEQTVAIRVRKCVIFGSGGFTQNPELRLTFLRGPVYGGCAVPTNQGDLIYMATGLGAQLENMSNAWWAQAVLESVLVNPSPPTDIFAVPGDSMIQVNRYGRRVLDEKFVYNERTQVHFQWDPVKAEYTNLFMIMIYDGRTADIWGSLPGSLSTYPIPSKDAPESYVISGETLEGLTSAIEARLAAITDRTGGFALDTAFAANLTETVARFNQFAEQGADLDFHRGETPIELAFHGPAAPGNDKPNRTMYPLSATGPYYGIILSGGTLDTKGGPKINDQAQILNTKDRPIPGLYGAGNCIGSPAGQAYWAGGGTIGPALTFGRIAAENATKEAPKDDE